jgi:hypothetical protein
MRASWQLDVVLVAVILSRVVGVFGGRRARGGPARHAVAVAARLGETARHG